MAVITNGATEAHEKLTARLYFQPSGDNGYHDLGNIKDYRQMHEVQTRTHMASKDGYRYVDDEQQDTIHQKWELTLDEYGEYVEQLLNHATQNSDITQASATGSTAQFTNVIEGRTYFLGARPVSSVVVEVSAATKTLGTDYTVDLNKGTITIVEGGGISSGDTVDVTYNVDARSYNSFTSRETIERRGSIKIMEFNQLSQEPLRELTFSGVIMVTAWPEQTGEFSQCTLRATATGQVTVKKRFAA